MKNKKLLFLCQYFYPEYVSSAVLPYETAKSMVEHGFDVSVICGYPSEYKKDGKIPINELYENIHINRVWYGLFRKKHNLGRILNFGIFFLGVLLHFFDLRNYSYIFVYSNPPILPLVAALASKLLGTKFIFICYDVYPEIAIATRSVSKSSLMSLTMRWINLMVFREATKIVALSSDMKQFLLNSRRGTDSNKISIIPNWSHDYVGDLSSINAPQGELPNNGKFMISYLGNFGVCQDSKTIIDAIRELKNDPNVSFRFAGHGTKMSLIKALIEKECFTNVSFEGFLHGEEYLSALLNSDAFIVSLAKGVEGTAVPSKTYSYMMAGKPIIAIMGHNTEIAEDIEGNCCGFVIEAGNVNQMLSAISKLCGDRHLCMLMGRNAREVYKNKYTYESSMDKYASLIENQA